MPSKPCPPPLRRLIKSENALPAGEPHPLRQILNAFKAKKQNKGPDTFAVKSISDVTINLTNCTVTVRNDLALALAQIDSPDTIDLIRECPIGAHLFWAGRTDKVACDAHVARWRQSEYRRKKKERQSDIRRENATAQLRKTITGLSRTAVALITVIMARSYQHRVFHEIDWWA